MEDWLIILKNVNVGERIKEKVIVSQSAVTFLLEGNVIKSAVCVEGIQ